MRSIKRAPYNIQQLHVSHLWFSVPYARILIIITFDLGLWLRHNKQIMLTSRLVIQQFASMCDVNYSRTIDSPHTHSHFWYETWQEKQLKPYNQIKHKIQLSKYSAICHNSLKSERSKVCEQTRSGIAAHIIRLLMRIDFTAVCQI